LGPLLVLRHRANNGPVPMQEEKAMLAELHLNQEGQLRPHPADRVLISVAQKVVRPKIIPT